MPTPPPHPILRRTTRGFLTVAQTAARYGISVQSLYKALRRGDLDGYSHRGGASSTGWTTYIRTKDIEQILRRPRPQHPIALNQAAARIGGTRARVCYYVRIGKLKSYRLPFAGGPHPTRIWLERDEVESLAKALARWRRGEPPKILVELADRAPDRPAAIAKILRNRPAGVTDTDIARAYKVSPQRVHEIKRKVLTQNG